MSIRVDVEERVRVAGRGAGGEQGAAGQGEGQVGRGADSQSGEWAGRRVRERLARPAAGQQAPGGGQARGAVVM
ncbi:hypothetical protein [Streptomyces sp. NPDC020330]|uniref:hypothetical protein n=1 Tax=unclassified Streptomyces TaxID=2593676 RepID=UPI0037B9C657